MTINCKGTLIDLSIPRVMGILNITPDSFYDGGKYKSDADFLNQTEKMLTDGATFIDVGAASSKPSAQIVSEEQELQRITPVITAILKYFPNILLSIDTYRSQVARSSIENGAAIINDISAGALDANMMQTVAKLNVPYIIMHMRGTPQTMQSLTDYENIIHDILFYFSQKLHEARSLGIVDLIVDPGFGFAKTTAQNFEILKYFELFQNLEVPILAGISRKSMIYKTLQTEASQALNGTTVLNTVAATKGASILRVHDVKEAVECLQLLRNLQ